DGWDTDHFPINISETVEAMLVILEADGFPSGGVNFDAQTRRNSTDLVDIFIAHISGMAVFARALLIDDKVLNESEYKKWRTERYASFDSGKGAEFEAGKLSLTDLRDYALANGEPKLISGKQELYEQLINLYI